MEPSDGEHDLVFRRGKLRRRDDPAVDLLREAQAHLDDPPRVRRILFEVGRLYDPVTNGPILDLTTRRQIDDLLRQGAREEVRAVLDRRVRDYVRPGPPGTPPDPGPTPPPPQQA